MKKFFMILGLSFGLFTNQVFADALKNSLTNILNEKDTSSSMVNLSQIDLNGKPKSLNKTIKTRSSKAVIATVNGHKVLKRDADAYLKKRTKGKMSNFDSLPNEQRLRLIQEMSLPILAMDSAQKELSAEEKESIYIRTWMQTEALKMNIKDEQVKKIYDQLKQKSQESNSTTEIPAFESIKDKMKMQIFEKQIVNKLMQNVDIKIEETN